MVFKESDKNHRHAFKFSTKPWIWSFNVVVLQRNVHRTLKHTWKAIVLFMKPIFFAAFSLLSPLLKFSNFLSTSARRILLLTPNNLSWNEPCSIWLIILRKLSTEIKVSFKIPILEMSYWVFRFRRFSLQACDSPNYWELRVCEY